MKENGLIEVTPERVLTLDRLQTRALFNFFASQRLLCVHYFYTPTEPLDVKKNTSSFVNDVTSETQYAFYFPVPVYERTSHKKGYVYEFINLKEKLGRGNFAKVYNNSAVMAFDPVTETIVCKQYGKVYPQKWGKITEMQVKSPRVTKLYIKQQADGLLESEFDLACSEYALSKDVPHLAMKPPRNDRDGRICLVMKKIQGQLLATLLDNEINPTSKTPALSQMQKIELTRALLYALKTQVINRIHGDINPKNIIVNTDDKGRYTAVIIDYQMAIACDSVLTCLQGTLGYIPPEVWESKPLTLKVDVYGMGHTVAEVWGIDPPEISQLECTLAYNRLINEVKYEKNPVRQRALVCIANMCNPCVDTRYSLDKAIEYFNNQNVFGEVIPIQMDLNKKNLLRLKDERSSRHRQDAGRVWPYLFLMSFFGKVESLGLRRLLVLGVLLGLFVESSGVVPMPVLATGMMLVTFGLFATQGYNRPHPKNPSKNNTLNLDPR